MSLETDRQEQRLTSFKIGDEELSVRFVETSKVKEGVVCDIYKFADDDTRDLAVITVKKDYKTPRQRVLDGEVTIEGHISGRGSLVVSGAKGTHHYPFYDGVLGDAVSVEIGEVMQWSAEDGDLVFYELCTPPYQDGRFENLPED